MPTKTPGPDHPMTIEKNPSRIRVMLKGEVIADSVEAFTLNESTYAPVHYIPRKDVAMHLLKRSRLESYCPYKGEASYFSIWIEGHETDNAVWTYEAPYPPAALIKDYLAFYPDRVDSIEEVALQLEA